MTLADHIRAARAAYAALYVPEDAPPKLLDLLRHVDYSLRMALQDAALAEALIETLRPMSDDDVARIIDEVQDGE